MTRQERIAKSYYSGGMSYVGIFELLQEISKERFNTSIVVILNGWVKKTPFNINILSWNGVNTSNILASNPKVGDIVGYIEGYPNERGDTFLFYLYKITECSRDVICGHVNYKCICEEVSCRVMYFDKHQCDFLEYSFRRSFSNMFKPKLQEYIIRVSANGNYSDDNRFVSQKEIKVWVKDRKAAIKKAKISKGEIIYSNIFNSNVEVWDSSEPRDYMQNVQRYLVKLK